MEEVYENDYRCCQGYICFHLKFTQNDIIDKMILFVHIYEMSSTDYK